jgi:hypothetical protein
MRRLTCLAFLATNLAAVSALAEPQDFQLYKLGNPATDAGINANANFRLFASQLGAAITSYNLEPPETLGHSGFNIAFEYAIATINNSPSVWPTVQGAPPSTLLMPTLHLRKGLPFSVEVGAKVSYLQESRMAAGTVEVKWALNEGFFYFPDLGIRGHGTHLVGSRDFSLTVAGLDIGLGHQFAIGGVLTLTPYAGFDMQWVYASSGVIDFNPGRSLADATQNPTVGTGVLSTAQMHQNYNGRWYFGVRLISYVFEVAAEASVVQLESNGFSAGGVQITSGEVVQKQVIVFGGKVGLDF